MRHEHVNPSNPSQTNPSKVRTASSCTWLAMAVAGCVAMVWTFEAIGCEGLARVDMFVTHEGQVVINEINTMPGFTQHSMFPRMWERGVLGEPSWY